MHWSDTLWSETVLSDTLYSQMLNGRTVVDIILVPSYVHFILLITSGKKIFGPKRERNI